MKRAEFIKLCASSALSIVLPNNLFPLNIKRFTGKDKYGGWTGKSFEATGFFRTEKADRWWLVTPEGHAFLSFGINHFHPGWWKAPYNIETWMNLLDAHEPDQFDPAFFYN